MTLTAKAIREHYQTPNIQRIITEKSRDCDTWRAGNGDFIAWYKKTKKEGLRLYDLSDSNDYKTLTKNHRVLYSTLSLFDDAVKSKRIPKTGVDNKGEKYRIGDFGNTRAYSLGVDIDGIGDIHDSIVRGWVEKAGAFWVEKMSQICPESIHVLFSGGGIYGFVHHKLFAVKYGYEGQYAECFHLLASTFNLLIKDIESDFFENYPEAKEYVKFDALNNQKRVFKSIFSIHKKHDLAVIPLDKNNIKIDLEKASIPLAEDVIQGGEEWYKSYDIKEKEALIGALKGYQDEVRERPEFGDYPVVVSDQPINQENFPPCIKRILALTKIGAGKTRVMALLASYLGEAGWKRDDALKFYSEVGQRLGINRPDIFNDWFGKMHCANCQTIQTKGGGFPFMHFGEVGICDSDSFCKQLHGSIGGSAGPVDYSLEKIKQQKKLEAMEPLKRPTLLADILSLLDKLAVGEEASKLLTLLSGISALNQCHDYVNSYRAHGDSAIGKSHIIKAVLSLEEGIGVVNWTSASPQSLAYLPENELTNKILFFDESKGCEDVMYLVRELQSEGRCKRAIAVRNEKTGRFETVESEVRGPVCVITTSVNEKVEQEASTRTWLDGRDKSQSQTEGIIQHQAVKVMRWIDVDKAIEAEIKKWRSALGTLKPYMVKIPFADKINFPCSDIRARRDHQRFQGLIMASALLHQNQRPRDEKEGILFAMPQDYDVAVKATSEALNTTLLGLTSDAKEFLDLHKNSDLKNQPFNVKTASKLWKFGSNKTYKVLESLYEAGYANREKDGRNNIYEITSSKLLPTLPKSLDDLVKPEDFLEYLNGIFSHSYGDGGEQKNRILQSYEDVKKYFPPPPEKREKVESGASPNSVRSEENGDLLIKDDKSLESSKDKQKNTTPDVQVHDLSKDDETEIEKTPAPDQDTIIKQLMANWLEIQGMERCKEADYTYLTSRTAKQLSIEKSRIAEALDHLIQEGRIPIRKPTENSKPTSEGHL